MSEQDPAKATVSKKRLDKVSSIEASVELIRVNELSKYSDRIGTFATPESSIIS